MRRDYRKAECVEEKCRRQEQQVRPDWSQNLRRQRQNKTPADGDTHSKQFSYSRQVATTFKWLHLLWQTSGCVCVWVGVWVGGWGGRKCVWGGGRLLVFVHLTPITYFHDFLTKPRVSRPQHTWTKKAHQLTKVADGDAKEKTREGSDVMEESLIVSCR